jgi:hypothetical protein
MRAPQVRRACITCDEKGLTSCHCLAVEVGLRCDACGVRLMHYRERERCESCREKHGPEGRALMRRRRTESGGGKGLPSPCTIAATTTGTGPEGQRARVSPETQAGAA